MFSVDPILCMCSCFVLVVCVVVLYGNNRALEERVGFFAVCVLAMCVYFMFVCVLYV